MDLSKWLAPCLFAFAASAAAQQVDRIPAPSPTPFTCVEAPKDGIPVRVVDAAGKPVAGAYVTWFESAPDRAEFLGPEPELTELRRANGKTVVTDRAGETRVGAGEIVVATFGSNCAGAWRGRRRSPFTLALKPARSITVIAVDRAHQPVADVPIALRSSESQRSPAREWHARTDATGAVTIGPLDLFADYESDALKEMFVAIDAPMKEPRRQRFTSNALPDGPVRFEMPPTGRLVIDVVDAEGKPATGVGSTTVRAPYDFEKQFDRNLADGESWPGSGWFVYDEAAHHELLHVEIGLRFVVDADRDSTGDVEQLVVGPKAAGEVIPVRLVGAPQKRITARVLDEHGEPLADRSVELLLSHDEHQRGRQLLGETRTDSQGRLSLSPRQNAATNFTTPVARWIALVVRDDASKRVVANAFVAVGATKKFEAGDLGDVRVHAVPRLVSGVVVDDAGTPVADADASVTIGMTKEESANFMGSFLSSGDALLHARSGADGKFEIDGDDPGAQLSLEASVRGDEGSVPLEDSRPVGFEAGATDLRIVLTRCGTIRGSVRGDPAEVDALGYAVHGTRADGSRFSWSSGLGADGEFEWSVPAGVAAFEFKQGGTVVAHRENVEVKPGAIVEIPPIELAGAAHQVELTVVDELGKPVPEGWVAMAAEGEDEHLEEMKKMFPPDFPGFTMMPLRRDIVWFKDGKATLRSEHEPRPFSVGAVDRAAVVVMHPATAERIVLEPAPVVRLAVDFDGDPLPDGLVFYVTLGVPSDAKDWFRFGPDGMSRFSSKYPKLDWIELARDKPTELPIRAVGPTALGLVIGRKSKFGLNGHNLESVPAAIDIARGKEQTFHVRVERAAIDQIVAEDAKEQEGRKKNEKSRGDKSDDDDDHR